MNEEYTDIDLLISKKLSGEITPEEITQLNNWIKKSERNQNIYNESKRVWEKNNHYLSEEDKGSDLQKIKSQIAEKESRGKVKIRRLTFFYRVAAVIAIPLLLTAGWYLATLFSSTPADTQLCAVSAPKGQIAKCVLADGTKVWLNAGTTITYNPSLSGKNRLVNLNGEAYFEVTKNPRRPFIVNTKKLQVKVLGTHFNVKAYPEDKTTETTLEEGSVELHLKDFPDQKPVELKPGEHATFEINKKDLKIEKTDTYLLTAWRDGKFIFKDATLDKIIKHLEHFYDVRIHLKNESMGKIRFRGMFSYDQNIFDALEAIEHTTSITYKMNGRDIWLE